MEMPEALQTNSTRAPIYGPGTHITEFYPNDLPEMAMNEIKKIQHTGMRRSCAHLLMSLVCLISSTSISGVSQTVGTTLRSWRTFYPMNRGQQRGQRAGNPWMASAGQNRTIGAQLTWDLPGGLVGDPSWSANRPNQAFPLVVNAWQPYYPAHQPEYYLNWWCQEPSPNVFYPAQHNCTNVYNYEELITEIPDVNGAAAAYLGLWAQGSQTSYTVNYDTGVCDLLANGDPSVDSALSDPSRSRPLLYGLPISAGSTFFGPAVCRVTFNNASTRASAYLVDYGREYIATNVFADFWTAHGHVVGALNMVYDGQPGHSALNCIPLPPVCSAGQSAGGNPDCSPVNQNDSSQGFNACVVYAEPYYMIDTGNSLVNGMSAWGQNYNGSGNGLNDVLWDTDKGWDGYTNSPPPAQFSFDSCTYGFFNNPAFLSCQ